MVTKAERKKKKKVGCFVYRGTSVQIFFFIRPCDMNCLLILIWLLRLRAAATFGHVNKWCSHSCKSVSASLSFRCGRISAASSSSLSSLSHPLSHTVLTSPYLTNDLSAHIPPVYRSPNITAITLPHQHHDRREFPSITCRLYSTDSESIRTPGDPLLSAALNM